MVECHVDATRTSSTTTPAPSLAPFLRRRLGLDPGWPAEDFLRSQPGWLPPADVDTSHLHLPGTGRQPVPLRLYRPRGVADPLPGLLWFHGGGFTRGGLDWGEAHPLALTLASQARIVVASVGYSTASYGHAWHDARRASPSAPPWSSAPSAPHPPPRPCLGAGPHLPHPAGRLRRRRRR